MPRWEPDVRSRLVQAALDLFTSQGYDATTVGDIADRAGVTKRTYNRHFPDKREVLFGGADLLRERIAGALRDAPAALPPLVAGLHAVAACEDLFGPGQHEQLRRRDDLISGSSELQEREARKLATIANTIADELTQRGTDRYTALLVADLSLAVFKQAVRLWMDDPAIPFAVLVERAATQTHGVLAQPETLGRT